jgi:UDP-2,3-diacylglucosamine hydrolase
MKVYFISDQHFRDSCEKGEQIKLDKFRRFIEHIKGCDALFIVGDLFHFFFEYKTQIPKTCFEVMTILKSLRDSGTKIHYFAGNHDFWLGDFFSEQIGATIYKHAQSMIIDGKKFFITHGDEFVTGNKVFRYILRNKLCIRFFYFVHPDIAYKIGAIVASGCGILSHKKGQILWIKVYRIVNQKFLENFDFVIFAHIHSPHWVHLKNKDVAILGDWVRHFSYGKFENGKFEMHLWK